MGYASLVDLQSGQVVWFNRLHGPMAICASRARPGNPSTPCSSAFRACNETPAQALAAVDLRAVRLWAASCRAQADWSPPPRISRPDAATDEGGLWALLDREEVRLRRSPFRIRDEALDRYLEEIICRLGGDHCRDIRAYVMQMPYFNANMAPNGMMQVWSGLLLRMENEAQFAAILAHEIGHYFERHTLQQLRDAKARSAFAACPGTFRARRPGRTTRRPRQRLAVSRDQEREADPVSVVLMRRAGYDARQAAKVWSNLLAELKANPGNDPDLDSVLFATHPPSEERQRNLAATDHERQRRRCRRSRLPRTARADPLRACSRTS